MNIKMTMRIKIKIQTNKIRLFNYNRNYNNNKFLCQLKEIANKIEYKIIVAY